MPSRKIREDVESLSDLRGLVDSPAKGRGLPPKKRDYRRKRPSKFSVACPDCGRRFLSESFLRVHRDIREATGKPCG
jgi:hypothetical protein